LREAVPLGQRAMRVRFVRVLTGDHTINIGLHRGATETWGCWVGGVGNHRSQLNPRSARPNWDELSRLSRLTSNHFPSTLQPLGSFSSKSPRISICTTFYPHGQYAHSRDKGIKDALECGQVSVLASEEPSSVSRYSSLATSSPATRPSPWAPANLQPLPAVLARRPRRVQRRRQPPLPDIRQ
jgi:hypothetical protein